jgi:hypothetical protein
MTVGINRTVAKTSRRHTSTMIANVSQRSAPATVTVDYDEDVAGAADALLAVLKQPRASADPENDENDGDPDEAA